jgi:TP901 family phage tail tape measure protein
VGQRARKLKVTLFGVNKLSGTLTKASRDVKRFGRNARSAGRSMTTGLSAPIALFGGLAIKSAADFEAGMLRVKGVTRTQGAEFKALEDQAKEMGRTTQFSASEAAAAQEMLARAGLDAGEVLGSLQSTLELAASSNVELAEAAQISAGMMNGYRLEVEDLTSVNDLLVNTNLRTQTTLTTLAEGMAAVAPIAASMGLGMAEVSAAVGVLGDNLIEGQSGGVALKTILGNLAAATPQAEQALANLGIPRDAILDSEGNVKSLIGTIKALEDAGAGQEEIFTIFGKRGALAVNALIGKGSEALKGLTGELTSEEAIGEAARQAAIRMEGAAGAMKGLASAFEGLQIAIGASGVLEMFTDFTKWLTDIVRDLSETNPAMLKWGSIIAGVLALIGPLVIGVGILATGIAGLIPLFAFLSVPVIAVVAGITALAVAAFEVWRNWDQISAMFRDVWAAMRESYSPLGFLIRHVEWLIGLPQTLIAAWATVGDFFRDLWSGLTAELVEFSAALPDFVRSRLGFGSGEVASGPATSGAASLRVEVGGQVGIAVGDERIRASRVESDNEAVPFDVSTGPAMALG